MGHIIEEIALSRGHQVVCAIDVNNQEDFGSEAFRTADVAIEFSTPKTCLGNVKRCLEAGVPVVVGSTGWYDQLPQVPMSSRPTARCSGPRTSRLASMSSWPCRSMWLAS